MADRTVLWVGTRHKVVLDPAEPDRLFMQFHAHPFTPDGERSSGVFRSDDAGRSWQAIDDGFPLTFGFPIVLSRKGELFVVPLWDDNRTFADGIPRIWRSEDAGESWRRLPARLPRALCVRVQSYA